MCHRIFCSTEAGSRAEQGADFAESFVRRLVHNGDELVTRQKCGKLFVGYAVRAVKSVLVAAVDVAVDRGYASLR